jgi:beta-glucanase (GH16 family)
MLYKTHNRIVASVVAATIGIGCSLLSLVGRPVSKAIAGDNPARMVRASQASPPGSNCDWTLPTLAVQAPVTTYSSQFPLSDQSNTGNWIANPALSDEFNGGVLDSTKWQPKISGWSGRQPGLIVPQNVSESNGTLNLKMVHQSVPAIYHEAGYQNYTTPAVESLKPVLYGYFEVRAKAMPSGASSAFWLAAQTPSDWNEIDVFEMGGKAPANPYQVFMTVHVFRVQGQSQVWSEAGVMNLLQSVAQNFHVYGLDWNSSSIDMYVDGQQVRHICNTNWTMPLNMIFDAETVPDWLGLPLFSDLPSTYQVDYVRVWKHATY